MNNLTQKLNQKKYIYLMFLVTSILIVAFVNWHPGYVFATGDYRYHINRINALAESFRHFNFLPKVDGYFSGGLGYASSLFYPDILLYPSAILKALGVNTVLTYLITLVAINFVTFLITYQAGKRLDFKNKNALIFTLIYVFSTYRLQVLFSRHDLGELLGMAFFPLVLSELIKFKKGEIREWYILAFAMIGIGFSHIISLFMIICFAAMFVILNIKYFWNWDVWKAILKAAGLTLGTIAAVFLPIFEQMLSQDFKVSTEPLIHIQDEIQPFTELVAHSFSNQVFHAHTVNIGSIIFFGLIIYTVYNFIKRKNISLTIIALFMFVACTEFFPWYQLRNSIFASFQFPWRFFSLISLIVSYFIANDDLKLFQKKYFTTAFVAVTLLLSFTMAQLTVQASPFRLNTYNSYDKISSYLIGAGHEYLPSSVNYDDVKENKPRDISYDKSTVSIENKTINKEYIQFDFDTGNTPTTIELPLFYYKGYSAKVDGNKSSFDPSLSDRGFTNIKLYGSGTFKMQYQYTFVQKLGLSITIIFLLYSGFILWRRRSYID
ncbi:YfhO family protein [Lactobacillus salsicarnum]|nr:YfhO family protein [Companilactobacillus mishanensis]